MKIIDTIPDLQNLKHDRYYYIGISSMGVKKRKHATYGFEEKF